MKDRERERDRVGHRDNPPPPVKNRFELMVILWCVYYGKRGIIFREEKNGSKVCCSTYSSIYPPSLRGETWLCIILSIFLWVLFEIILLSSGVRGSFLPFIHRPVRPCALRSPLLRLCAGKGRGQRGGGCGHLLHPHPHPFPPGLSRALSPSRAPAAHPERCQLPAEEPLRWRGAKV